MLDKRATMPTRSQEFFEEMADSPRYEYERVADQIRSAILDGSVEERLPPEGELAAIHNVSRGTLREALDRLQNEGLIERKQGVGTIILRQKPVPKPLRLRPLSKDLPRANFQKWRHLVKLDQSFPKLHDIKWAELDEKQKIYLNYDHRSEMEKILAVPEESPAIKPLTMVVVNSGHGCTTIFRYVTRLLITPTPYAAPKARSTKTIPVRISWSRLGSQREIRESIEDLIRVDILRGLVGYEGWRTWEPEPVYSRLIGATDRGVKLNQQRDQLGGFVREDQWDEHDAHPPRIRWAEVEEIAPRLVEAPVLDLMKTIREDLEIKVLLMFDLSTAGRKEDVRDKIADIVSWVKDMHEVIDQTHGTSRFMEMYFASREQLDFMDGLWARSRYEIIFPPFEQPDFFGILTRHYPPVFEVIMSGANVERVYAEYVSAVIEPEILRGMKEMIETKHGPIEGSGSGFSIVSLRELAALFEEMIETKIMNRPWKDISYRLSAPGPDDQSGTTHGT